MKRDIMSEIVAWNSNPRRKPLILMGARQVGKTWLMERFAEEHYSGNHIIVNLMDQDVLRENIESGNIDPDTIIRLIELETGKKITPGKTLLILDEIQESPRALTSLKFFCERKPELAVMVAGSLLGLSLRKGRTRGNDEFRSRGSFPVGKVEFIDVRPMTFCEFLEAVGEKMKVELIRNHDWQMLSTQHESMRRRLKEYLVVGGMPAAVDDFIRTGDLNSVRKIQGAILRAYDKDFEKHANGALLTRIRLLWNNIPAQLAKENKKFIYTAMKPGARAREYEEALEWLDDAGMIRILRRVSIPRMPIAAYEDFSAFKIYLADVGLLGAMSGLPPKIVLDGNSVFTNFKGALTEQYVLGELAARNLPIGYWTADNGDAEVDFVVQGEESVYPLEVKAERNLKARSLAVYKEKFLPATSFRTSLAKEYGGTNTFDVPLYALSGIEFK